MWPTKPKSLQTRTLTGAAKGQRAWGTCERVRAGFGRVVRACACTCMRAARGAGPGGGKSVHYLAVRVFLFVAGHGFSVPTRTRDRVFFLALGVDPESARGEGEGTTLCDFGDAAGRGGHDRAELGGSWPGW